MGKKDYSDADKHTAQLGFEPIEVDIKEDIHITHLVISFCFPWVVLNIQ